MSVRRVRGSFRGSLRRYGSVESAKKPVRHFQWIYRKGEWRIAYEDGDEVTLMYAKHERLPMKDFAAEVRASMDVDQFLNQAVLLLDVQESSVEGIIDKMLHKVLDTRESLITIAEAKEAIFTEDSVHLLSRTIQGTYVSEGGGFDYDQSWLCAMCNLASLQKRHVAIARLKHPANMGRTLHEVRFFILVLTPSKEKGTKNALETGRTFATIFADMDFRQRLLEVHSEAEFKNVLLKHAQDLAAEQSNPSKRLGTHDGDLDFDESKCRLAQGLWDDIRRRSSLYISDFIDGFVGHKTIHKTISTICFLYFACILPTIAFGALNDNNTHGQIDVRKSILGQTLGGLTFALLGGQPLVIVMTTAPLSLYIKVIFNICQDFQLNFHAMYACVGLWNTFFLIIFSIFDVSRIMKWSTRSTEEIFSLFISIAFIVDAGRDVYKNFHQNYFSSACMDDVTSSVEFPYWLTNSSINESQGDVSRPCKRENSLLFLLLMFGTVWLAVSLYNFNKTPYLQASKREILADYALPVAVISMSFLGSFVFRDVATDHFRYDVSQSLSRAPVEELPWTASVAALGMGFALSLLFFMDQNITAAMVNNPCNKLNKGPVYDLDLFVVGVINFFLSLHNFVVIGSFVTHRLKKGPAYHLDMSVVGLINGFLSLHNLVVIGSFVTHRLKKGPHATWIYSWLKKGPAYHLDLFVVGVINGFLSLYGLPWMHGVLPHSPLHVRSLADVEERVEQGHVYEIIVKVRETRITGIVSHIFIGLSIFLLPYPLAYIPTAVLNGLFLYMAITSLNGNQMFERITLLFMEQAAYPPNHYIRRCPQRKIHIFTMCQVLQLAIMCFFGFSPWSYVKMVFPVIIFLLLPFRHKVVPCLVDGKYLEALDGEHQ